MKLRCRIILTLLLVAANIACGNTIGVFLKSSPASGGYTSPLSGIHEVEQNSFLSIRAIPKRGFRFLHWLGVVENPTSISTMVLADSPKVIIAVFERTEFASVGGGGGGQVSVITHINREFWPMSWRGSYHRHRGHRTYKGSHITPDPIPECATVILLAAGGICFRKKRRKV